MSFIATFADVQKTLDKFLTPDDKPHLRTLEQSQALLDFLGHPELRYKVVHIVGTSGKTSTAYYTAALLRKAGYKVGLTVSPHITSINERVQINLLPLSQKQFCADFNTFMDLVAKSQLRLRRGEVLSAFAYWCFARHGVQFAVVEAGIGGLLDSSNAATSPDKTCIIADIGLDHQDILGHTVAKIAEHKAGIIGLHNTVFCREQASEILAPIRAQSSTMQADLHIVPADDLQTSLHFLPLFQQRNLQLALTAVKFILQRHNHEQLTKQQIQQVAENTIIPGRMETFYYKDKTIIFDGAHNAQKCAALVASLKQRYPGKPIAAVVAAKAAKYERAEGAMTQLVPALHHAIVTTYPAEAPGYPQGEDPNLLAALLKAHGLADVKVVPESKQAWKQLLQRPEPILLVTGSFYVFNDIRPLALKLTHQKES